MGKGEVDLEFEIIIMIIKAWILSNCRFAAQPPLYQALMALRPQMAAAAQSIYNEWTQDEEGFDEEFGGGGICDQISQALASIVAMNIGDAEIEEGGQDGDDHAYNVVTMGRERYIIDIPYGEYETGGGYNWKKIPNVVFQPDHIVIERI